MVTEDDIGVVANKPWIMIPTCGASPQLIHLVTRLSTRGYRVCVVINNVDDRTELKLVGQVVNAGGYVFLWPEQANIYEVWNWAIMRAQKAGASSLAILNDDIEIDPDDVYRLDTFLVMNNKLAIVGWDYGQRPLGDLLYVRGSFRKGGVGGFAFSVKPERVPYVDERFNWWGGDDDLFAQTEANGYRLAIAPGAHVIHYTSTSANANPSVYDRCGEDRQLLLDKWGDTW